MMISVEEYLATSHESDRGYLDGQVVDRKGGEWDDSSTQDAAAAEGLRELRTGRLKTENPTLELPLGEIFA
jgi:hypothetical protein